MREEKRIWEQRRVRGIKEVGMEREKRELREDEEMSEYIQFGIKIVISLFENRIMMKNTVSCHYVRQI